MKQQQNGTQKILRKEPVNDMETYVSALSPSLMQHRQVSEKLSKYPNSTQYKDHMCWIVYTNYHNMIHMCDKDPPKELGENLLSFLPTMSGHLPEEDIFITHSCGTKR